MIIKRPIVVCSTSQPHVIADWISTRSIKALPTTTKGKINDSQAIAMETTLIIQLMVKMYILHNMFSDSNLQAMNRTSTRQLQGDTRRVHPLITFNSPQRGLSFSPGYFT